MSPWLPGQTRLEQVRHSDHNLCFSFNLIKGKAAQGEPRQEALFVIFSMTSLARVLT